MSLKILCVMRIPPHPEGHGGNQRAWHLLQALAGHGQVHLMLVYPAEDAAAAGVSLDRAASVAHSISIHRCEEWQASASRYGIPWSAGIWLDLIRLGSLDAPRLRQVAELANKLTVRDFDVVVACRLSSATIADRLLSQKLITAKRRVVDIDDLMSVFRSRQLAVEPAPFGWRKTLASAFWRTGRRREIGLLRREEDRIAADWNSVGVCSDDDAVSMVARVPTARLVRIPNVVDRPELPARNAGAFRLLFVGNLAFAPNVHGLTRFVNEVRPLVRKRSLSIELEVVGMGADATVRAMLAQADINLFENVASVVPHYAAADAVVAPIFFGGGTRIKIIEAMAFGRPIIATTLAAEGLALVDGVHVLLADDPTAMADAVLRLAQEPAVARSLAVAARQRQQEEFGPAALRAGVKKLLTFVDDLHEPA